VLLRAIHDGTHALLHREVLGVDAAYAGEGLRFLFFAVDEVIVSQICLEERSARHEILRAAPVADFQPLHVFGGQRRGEFVGAHPVEYMGVLIVDRHPQMAVITRDGSAGATLARHGIGAHLLEGHDVVVHAHILALIAGITG
jgi:hypothetical protein